MREDEFDPHLALSLVEPSAFDDEAVFLAALDRRLAARARRRRVALSLAGVAGGGLALAGAPTLFALLARPASSLTAATTSAPALWVWTAAGAAAAVVAFALREA